MLNSLMEFLAVEHEYTMLLVSAGYPLVHAKKLLDSNDPLNCKYIAC